MNGQVGIGTDKPNGSSILDIESTSQGVLLPRMSTTQMNAISTPAQGLMIYNTDDNCPFSYTGTHWTSTCSKIYRNTVTGSTHVTVASPSVELAQSFTLAGQQNVMILTDFSPQPWTNGVNKGIWGKMELLLDGTVVDTNIFSTQNNGNFLYRYSSVISWVGQLAPGTHNAILRITRDGGNGELNARHRILSIYVN